MDLLLILENNKFHFAYIKDFNRFMFNKTKHKTKTHFCRYCLQCFSNERILSKHKKVCLKTNGKQSVKFGSSTNKLENYFKQIAVPIKIYAYFECNLQKFHTNERGNGTSYTEKNQNHIPCGFAYKIACVDNDFSKPVALNRSENAVCKFIEAIPKEYDYCKKLGKSILIKI